MRDAESERNRSGEPADERDVLHSRDPVAARDATRGEPRRRSAGDPDEATTRPGNEGNPEADRGSRAWREGETSKLGDAGWGSEAAGGSVIDKRRPREQGSE